MGLGFLSALGVRECTERAGEGSRLRQNMKPSIGDEPPALAGDAGENELAGWLRWWSVIYSVRSGQGRGGVESVRLSSAAAAEVTVAWSSPRKLTVLRLRRRLRDALCWRVWRIGIVLVVAVRGQETV